MDGVLDKEYAQARERKAYLAFRYKSRALVAAGAINRHIADRPPVLSVVDLGAAEGKTLVEMARRLGPGDYLGVEYDESLMLAASDLPASVKLIQGDINDLFTVPDASVDAVTALAVLEHLTDPVRALAEVRRILKPGGVLVATAPSHVWDKLSERIGPKNKFARDHHFSRIAPDTVREFGEKAGLEFVAFRPFMWVPIAFLPYLKMPVSPTLAEKVDKALAALRVFNWSFANQLFVLRKK